MSCKCWLAVTAVGMFSFAMVISSQAQEGKWAAADDPTAKALIDLERQWAEAACTQNGVTKKILAEDFQGTSPDGKRYSKREAVAPPKESRLEERDCRLLDAKVRFFGDRVALVYGSESSVKMGADEKEYTRSLVWTDTWLKRDGKWQIVAAQDMLLPEALSDDKSSAGNKRGVRDRLIGTWSLVSDYEIRPDGSRRSEYGPHPLGYLMYDKTGHMCVTLATPNPTRWADPAKPTDAERVVTHKSMEAYCGTYEVREATGQVIHRPELAEWPHYIGTDQVRHYRFTSDDEIVLSLEEVIPGGEKYGYEITWKRVH
jgi:Lipocalin-like domain/Domain of unknown function (DUF4440)